MGPAVSDAAAWYELADWVGINTTPHATLFINSLLEQTSTDDINHVLVEYDVPLKNGRRMTLKAENWPKGFFLPGLRPEGRGKPRAAFLTLLGEHRIPIGSEAKYFNTVEFFDHIVSSQNLNQRFLVSPVPPTTA